MTLWAKKSDFELAFNDSHIFDTDWAVQIREEDSEVVFIIEPTQSCSINVKEFKSSHAFEQMTSCGAKSVELELSNDPKFMVTVERSKLPEEYAK